MQTGPLEYFREKRFALPWQERYEPLSRPQIEDRLERGDSERLRVKLPDADLPLPLQSQEDLKEAEVFARQLPPDQLARPDLGQALTDLASAGWSFRARPGQVGGYGAYNALTDPERRLESLVACKGELKVPLQPDTPAALRDFQAHSPLARLEDQGYLFQDDRGRPIAAFLAGPGSTVGRQGEAWLPSQEADSARLQEFAAYRSDAPELAQARRAYQVAHDPHPPSLGQLADELPWLLAEKAGTAAGAAPLTAAEVRQLSVREPALNLVGQASRVAELADSVAAGHLWGTDLPPSSQELVWKQLFQREPVRDEATRLQAFQAALEALPQVERPRLLSSELSRPGVDPLLVASYADRAGSDLMPVFDRLGAIQPGLWNSALQTPEARTEVQRFFLKHPQDGTPDKKLQEFWSAGTRVPNEERARLVRCELPRCTRQEEARTLGSWLLELDPQGAEAELGPLLAKYAPTGSKLAREWGAVLDDPAARATAQALLLEVNPQKGDGPERVALLQQLWKRLPGSVDNGQRSRLVQSNLQAVTDQDSRFRLLSWALELDAPGALEQARSSLASPELDSWLGALTTPSARRLAVELALELPQVSSVEKMKTFWQRVPREVKNPERATLVQSELERLAGSPERWTLASWLVELKGAEAGPALDAMWKGEPVADLAREWTGPLGPEGRKTVLAELVNSHEAQDTPGQRVELLQKLLQHFPSSVDNTQRSALVEANLNALETRAGEDGWPEAVLKLCAWKAELSGPEGVPEILDRHPATRPYAAELQGWMSALPAGKAQQAAMEAILNAPTGQGPKAREERLQEFWRRVPRDIPNEQRAPLVSWSVDDLLTRPADAERDEVLKNHLGWLYELQGEQQADRVVQVLGQLPSQADRAARLEAWRKAVSSQPARKAVTQELLYHDYQPEARQQLEHLFQDVRTASELPNPERAALVRAELGSVADAAGARQMAGWLYELEGESALPQVEQALNRFPESQPKAAELREWLEDTDPPVLRRAVVEKLLGDSQDVLLDALVSVRHETGLPNEARAELVRRRLARASAPEDVARMAGYLAQLAPPQEVEPVLQRLGTPAARAALGWGQALTEPKAVSQAYRVWLGRPQAQATASERSEALQELLPSTTPEERERLLRYELGQLERLPHDGERDQAVGKVGAALLEVGEGQALPIVFKLLGQHPVAAWYQELVAGAPEGEARKLIGRAALSKVDLRRADELGIEVLTAYSPTHVETAERVRVTLWTVDRLLDPAVSLREALPPAEEFLGRLGDGLLQPAARRLLEQAAGRFQRTPTLQVSLRAQAQRVEAATSLEEAQRLLQEGMTSLKAAQEIEDLLRPEQDIAIKEEDQAVLVGGVRVSKREQPGTS